MKTLGALAALLLVPSLGWCGFNSSANGTSPLGFLQLGAGARPAALGGSYCALADDATALYWNPAALTRIPGRSATFMHAAYIDSSFFDYAAFGQKLEGAGAFGVGLQYLSAGKIAQTDETGTDMGDFSPNDLAVSAGYASQANGFSLGLSAKYIRSRILRSAQTGAVDLGVLSPPLLDDKLRLAFTMSNLGAGVRYESESEGLPLAARLGSAYRIRERWTAALDVGLGFPDDGDPAVALGTEYRLPVMEGWTLAGRAGFDSRGMRGIDGLTGLAFGLGLGYQKLAVDYAAAPMGSLGLTQRMSVSSRF
jgi:hypothetical protein